jgi:monoamine oxidase
MIVTTADGVDNAYSQVISSIPLPSLTAVKLDRCSLSWDIKSALRELAYGPSTKIGIMFRENWWEPMGIVGGQSFTDSPIRTVVYPSYGPATGPKSRVLIASYARSQDALRMGSLFGDDSESQTLLLNIVLNELEKVHEITPGYLRKYYDPNDTKNCAIFPWNWYSDNLTMGMSSQFFRISGRVDEIFWPRCLCVLRPWAVQKHLSECHPTCM